jgi:hypothetical protein
MPPKTVSLVVTVSDTCTWSIDATLKTLKEVYHLLCSKEKDHAQENHAQLVAYFTYSGKHCLRGLTDTHVQCHLADTSCVVCLKRKFGDIQIEKVSLS